MKFIKKNFFRKKQKEEKIEPKKSPILFDDTQAIIKKIEQFYQGDFLVYWIGYTTMLKHDQVYVLNRILNDKVKSDHLIVFVKSLGGYGTSALRATHLFRSLYKKITFLIPFESASASTLLAIGGDNIKIGPTGYLTAIDSTTWHELAPPDGDFMPVGISHDELNRTLNLWESKKREKDPNPYSKLYKYIHPLAIGAVDRANSLSIKLATEIMSYHLTDLEKATKISEHLNSQYPEHAYPITLKEAQKVGLQAEALEPEMHQELIKLNELYGEMSRTLITDLSHLKRFTSEMMEIIEMNGEQCFHLKEFEYRYNKDVSSWRLHNDESGWRSVKIKDGEQEVKRFYIR